MTASIWAAPVILGLLMSAGLITALVGDGLWDALACALLIGVMSYAAVAARIRRASTPPRSDRFHE